MKKRIFIILVTLIFAVVIATPALADGSVTASVTASNSAPTLNSVTLQQSDKSTAANSMDPLSSYVVEIVVNDLNTIDDIETIDIYIFYDGDAGDDGVHTGAFDPDERAIYKWTKAGDVWSIEQGSVSSTTWTITAGSCDTPADFGLTQGEWNLVFTPGKLAVEADGTTAEWDIYVLVNDVSAGNSTSTIFSKAMTAYSEISMSSATMSFGSVALGGTAAIHDAGNKINTIVVSNDTHALGVMSAGTWIVGSDSITLDDSGTPDAAGEFSLRIDDAADGNGIPTTPQAVTNSNATITGHATDTRTETSGGNEGTSQENLYMSLSFYSSGIDIGLYTGTITFSVTNN